eukprot:TRINITY_DN1566_c0_g1_i2.p2 TRINITY_DN1566_c0_g1~~TRINITY_DN1566_c0_g1_i2.p2  ORF type:complete len:57 (+),score=6.31 TRINITY_DN1566_c0_g1_i2:192-362(+)
MKYIPLLPSSLEMYITAFFEISSCFFQSASGSLPFCFYYPISSRSRFPDNDATPIW